MLYFFPGSLMDLSSGVIARDDEIEIRGRSAENGHGKKCTSFAAWKNKDKRRSH